MTTKPEGQIRFLPSDDSLLKHLVTDKQMLNGGMDLLRTPILLPTGPTKTLGVFNAVKIEPKRHRRGTAQSANYRKRIAKKWAKRGLTETSKPFQITLTPRLYKSMLPTPEKVSVSGARWFEQDFPDIWLMNDGEALTECMLQEDLRNGTAIRQVPTEVSTATGRVKAKDETSD